MACAQFEWGGPSWEWAAPFAARADEIAPWYRLPWYSLMPSQRGEMIESWHEERDRLVKLIAGVEAGEVTHVDEQNIRQLQPINPINIAALHARLHELNARLGSDD